MLVNSRSVKLDGGDAEAVLTLGLSDRQGCDHARHRRTMDIINKGGRVISRKIAACGYLSLNDITPHSNALRH